MKIVIANDHGAIQLKEVFRNYLEKSGHMVKDLGVSESVSCDYPDIVKLAVKEYRKGGYDFGILLCGTGIGVSIAANKFKGIRCALPQNIFAARMAKEHNNANFISFGGRIEYHDDPTAMLDIFINSTFEGGRHQERVNKITKIDNEECG